MAPVRADGAAGCEIPGGSRERPVWTESGIGRLIAGTRTTRVLVAVAALLALTASGAYATTPSTSSRFGGGAHEGREAVSAYLAPSQRRLPDVQITVERVDVAGEAVTAEWQCRPNASPNLKDAVVRIRG